eukprot:CAMPEP_0204543364 /NCGR_PEP_ID=MMETSP0661-20131031/19701_1 /ASSEMBLY_ACC=CAM_ASM_000606 /TAXON_ID=109239 /ORGANISM="Alexandrium margalefi, Strain AMGDE01CS-322" /LENGTH=77 /DNA_ID=CAMNT_0051550087 /DNA_START=11 /DNA_END=241 /DNA_ORIENTATION=-
MAFSSAVMDLDRDLHSKVESSMKSKADLVEHIRLSRQSQLKMLEDLIHLTSVEHAAEAGGAPAGLSFLETRLGRDDP